MITICFVGLVLAVIVMEFIISPRMSYHLGYRYSYDTELAEPGEKIIFTGRLFNGFSLPIVYVPFSLSLPEGASIVGKKRNVNHEAYRMSLLPHRSSVHNIVFSLPKRGVYRGGRYFIETGDFLGFRSFVRSEKLTDKITVMPRKCEDEQVIKALGGYIGDISVRRFIIEDPILTIGFREYTGHEPMKKISWPQSVRTGKLVVKNNDYTVDMNVAVVLNLYNGTNAEKEKSLEIVRTVCEQLEASRVPYSFFSNGDIREKKEGFGPKHLSSLMMDLGSSELFSYNSFETLMDRCIRKRKQNRSYIIVTPPLSPMDKLALGRLIKLCDYAPCVLEAEVTKDGAH